MKSSEAWIVVGGVLSCAAVLLTRRAAPPPRAPTLPRAVRALVRRCSIPSDVFRDRVLPYTYRPQPAALRADLLSYHVTMAQVTALYGARFPTGPTTHIGDSDRAWLSNDISRFLSDDLPIEIFGYAKGYPLVFQRLYRNHAKSLSAVSRWLPTLVDSDDFNDIKVSIGVLRPTERLQLTAFLGRLGGE